MRVRRVGTAALLAVMLTGAANCGDEDDTSESDNDSSNADSSNESDDAEPQSDDGEPQPDNPAPNEEVRLNPDLQDRVLTAEDVDAALDDLGYSVLNVGDESDSDFDEERVLEKVREHATPLVNENDPGPETCAQAHRQATLPTGEAVGIDQISLFSDDTVNQIIVSGASDDHLDAVRAFMDDCATFARGGPMTMDDEENNTVVKEEAPKLGDDAVAFVGETSSAFEEEVPWRNYAARIYVAEGDQVLVVGYGVSSEEQESDPALAEKAIENARMLTQAAYDKLTG